jgi:arylsulfatase A-like enzyme
VAPLLLAAPWAVGTRDARAGQTTAERPHVVYILADDLGYGDLRCFNPDSKIATPHLDRLAAQGMIFTDAHSGSAVCSPTRYGILTGRYSWRTRLQRDVLSGYSLPLIARDRLTVAGLLKKQGYHTVCVGKWHLGLGWALDDPAAFLDTAALAMKTPKVDYSRPIQDGPTTRGFDEFFGISGSLDMHPYIYIQNDRTVGLPTVEKTIVRKGPAEPDFEAVDVLSKLTEKARLAIDEHGPGGGHAGEPLFLYFPLTAPHAPVVPEAEFAGKSGISAYADFVMQTDAAVGAVLAALERNGLAEKTLVIVTSDNGCSPVANFKELAAHGHNPSGRFRGQKADAYEGGHRVPFLARWPGRIKPGATCADPICLTDLMATVAAIVGISLPDNAGEDSVNLLPDLLGTAHGPQREAVVHHSLDGIFAIRQGPWKLILSRHGGGYRAVRPLAGVLKGLPPIQLYNLDEDPAETRNVQAENPDIVARLTRLLERYVAEGRSTPGTPQANDSPIQLRKDSAS